MVTVKSSMVSLVEKIISTANMEEETTQSHLELRSEKLLPCRLKKDLQRLMDETL